jgi:hypothetical protein
VIDKDGCDAASSGFWMLNVFFSQLPQVEVLVVYSIRNRRLRESLYGYRTAEAVCVHSWTSNASHSRIPRVEVLVVYEGSKKAKKR